MTRSSGSLWREVDQALSEVASQKQREGFSAVVAKVSCMRLVAFALWGGSLRLPRIKVTEIRRCPEGASKWVCAGNPFPFAAHLEKHRR